MVKTEVLEKIEKIEKDVKELREIIHEQELKEVEEEKAALEAVRIYEKEKGNGKLILLKDPKELLK